MFKNVCAETAQILTSKNEGKSFGAPGVLPKAEKPVRGTSPTSVRDHMFICGHQRAWEDFKILGRESNKFILKFKDRLFIKRNKPGITKKRFSQELIFLKSVIMNNFTLRHICYAHLF